MNGYNFTERVRKVLAMAREEAARLHHEYVGTEHILLGLIREGEGVAAQVQREHEVGLLHHLLAVEVEVGEVQEQGVLVRPGVSEVPHRVLGKSFCLGGHSESLVPYDEHLLSRAAPACGLV